MVNSYSEFLKGTKALTDANQSEYEYTNIWKAHPSYKDVNSRFAIIKTIFLTILGLMTAVGIYVLSRNVLLSLGLTLIIILLFVFVFHDTFFHLKGLFTHNTVNPFSDLIFWKIAEDTNTIYFTHKGDLFTVGIKMFYIKVMPENVHPNLNRFLKTLSGFKAYIPFTYQVAHAPLGTKNFKTYLFFTIFSFHKGRINEDSISMLRQSLMERMMRMQSSFSANFHHFQIVSLQGAQLLHALRCTFINKPIDIEAHPQYTNLPSVNSKSRSLFKGIFIGLILTLFNTFFILFTIPPFLIGIINIGFMISVLVLWWRPLLFVLSHRKLFSFSNVILVNPFTDTQFYYFSQFPDMLFAHINNESLTGIKLFNLQYAFPPAYCSFSKFYSGLNVHNIPFTYTVMATPCTYYQFEQDCLDYIDDKERNIILKYITNEMEALNWLSRRAGIWKTMLLLSTSHTIPTRSITTESISHIIEQLHQKGMIISQTFGSCFDNFIAIPLMKKLLLSGVQCELLKTNRVRLQGTHLNQVIFEGKALSYIIHIADELKKGVETRIAAEFNSPMAMENFIEIGSTINTEILAEEVPTGFSFEQLHSLLITNGIAQSRELLAMKLVVELVKKEIPSIVFDFTGGWSKLLTYFKGTKFQANLSYFKLGKVFTLDPIHSEIPHDGNNLSYLEYMFDAYALCFKKNERTMDTFKNTIRNKQNIDISNLRVALDHQKQWEKDESTEALLALFHDFSQEDLAFFYAATLADEKKIKAHDFVVSPKTIIIDISVSGDYDKQCFFAFIILSKIIHYISQNNKFISKFLFLPHLDLIFDSTYLDKTANYGKIDKFFAPLIQNEFGIIGLTNQVRYLHSNAFNYFQNIVAFKSTDTRDIAALSSIMNLNELHGTGYYNTQRNETYQIHYLRNMKPYEIIMKRSDIYQPFPAVVKAQDLEQCMKSEYHQIVEHMGSQGYDLEYSEKQILSQAEKSLFELHLGKYFIFLEHIMKFLKNLSIVDKVSGLYIDKVKKELKDYLYPAISAQVTQDKTKINAIRNIIFDLLVEHRYLIESHPKSAGGSSTVRTSYSVGPQYQISLEDYYKHQQIGATNVRYDVMVQESNSLSQLQPYITPAPSAPSEHVIQKVKEVLVQEFGINVIRDLFTMHKALNQNDYATCLTTAREMVSKFLTKAYIRYYQPKYIVTIDNLTKIIDLLSSIEDFPFYKEELTSLLETTSQIKMEEANLEQESNEMYSLMDDFCKKIQRFLGL